MLPRSRQTGCPAPQRTLDESEAPPYVGCMPSDDSGSDEAGASSADGLPPSGAEPVYTRTGDAGETGLRGGQRVAKHDARVEAYGTVDELNAQIGVARELARQQAASCAGLSSLAAALFDVQHRLFTLGSTLATLPEDLPAEQRRITEQDVVALEREMDRRSAALAPLTQFILPGGCTLNAELHLARTLCRRAERRAVQLSERGPVDPSSLKYLNRLSDALFIWARWAAAELGAVESHWDPNRP